jgi:glycosyltransferase involved in cell wall biosynthesis
MPYQTRVAASSGGDIAPYLSPMKMFEYLASGRPILASDLPVLGEVLTAENALILPPADVDAWLAAIEKLRAQPKLREKLGGAARQTAQRYSWEARAERILAGLGK